MLCAREDLSIFSNIQQQLFDLNFIQNLKTELQIISPIIEFLNNVKDQNLVDATSKLLGFQLEIKDLTIFTEIRNKCITKQGLLGCFLDPNIERNCLLIYMRSITEYVSDLTESIIHSFSMLKRNEGIFRKFKEKKLSFIDFWTNIKDFEEHQDLADLALRIYEIPASAYFENIPEFEDHLENLEDLITISLNN